MSAPTIPHDYVGDRKPQPTARRAPNPVYKVVQAIASLRLTVVLFSLGLVLVLFGTLGMMRDSIDGTVTRYFRSWFVLIDLHAITDFGKVFLNFSKDAELPGKIPFPGGYTIGWLMFINLLAAHAIRFKLTWKRSGIFLLHAGVIVLLAGEFFTGQYAVETRMMIEEGQSARYVHSLDKVELAFVDPSSAERDEVVVVPGALIPSAASDEWVSREDVPVDFRVVDYFANADVVDPSPGDGNPSNRGTGLKLSLERKAKVKGTESGGEINYPAAYVALRDKTGKELGTFLFSTQMRRPQIVPVGDKPYQVALRFKRTYKPYTVELLKAEHKVYAGTNTAKDFASTVVVHDPEQGDYGPVRIWMNHPMFNRGETFYQSSMNTDPRTGLKTTGLQVVENFSWRFPYAACAMVAAGMLVHFLIRLITFLISRRKLAAVRGPRPFAPTPKSVPTESTDPKGVWQKFARYFPFAVAVLAVAYLLGRAVPPSAPAGKKDLNAIGQIPVQHGGRIQPLDSLARNTLMVISGKSEFVDTGDNDRTYSAIEWLLVMWAKPDKAENFRVFRIENLQLLALLEVPERPGSFRYSMAELEPRIKLLETRATEASRKEKEQRTKFDDKAMDLARHVEMYRALEFRKNPGLIPTDEPDGKWMSYGDIVETAAPQFFKDAEQIVRKELVAQWDKDPGLLGELVRRHLPGIQNWEEAKRQFGGEEKIVRFVIDQEVRARVRPIARENFLKSLPDAFPPAATMEKILDAYKADDAAAFNAAVAEYKEKHTAGVSESDQTKVRLEARMNHFNPFVLCKVLYIGVLVLAAASWLFWHQPLRRAAFGLACVTLVVHTAALLARMYIGNRPPVTNLYSSAVFIGWGGLALCLVLERFYKLGIGTFAGGLLGFATMHIAQFLAESGDTLEMLQAVLDTNFWLATHVLCVTLGYVTTLVAGVLAMVYLLGGVFTNGMRGDNGKQVAGMLYGTICFATLMSFTGTVLGGIWADQSWGRFWGWDPKENGAVLVVIWNVLILHARWAGLVKARGMAVLAVIGNMVTFWSWFGTNQLGIGLHAYGFDNRLVLLCDLVWISMALIACLGMIPLKYWASFAQTTPAKA